MTMNDLLRTLEMNSRFMISDNTPIKIINYEL